MRDFGESLQIFFWNEIIIYESIFVKNDNWKKNIVKFLF